LLLPNLRVRFEKDAPVHFLLRLAPPL
jgi:hypothetical protein